MTPVGEVSVQEAKGAEVLRTCLPALKKALLERLPLLLLVER